MRGESAEAGGGRDRVTFVLRAGEALATPPYRSALRRVARLALPAFADWCVIDLRESHGSFRRLAAAHTDRRLQARVQALRGRFPLAAAGSGALAAALREGRPCLESALHDAAPLPAASIVAAPLLARGRTLGALTLGRDAGRPPFDDADLAAATDVAQRAALAVDNERLAGTVRATRGSRDRFLAALAHELRTPLTAILGWLRLLRADSLDADWRARGLEVIERNGRALAHTIDELLDASRVLLGEVALETRPVDLAAVVERALAAASPAAAARRVAIDVVLERALPAVAGDAERLSQVVSHLLSAAIGSTPSDGRVSLHLARDAGALVLTVSDEGGAPAGPPSLFADLCGPGRGGIDLGLGLAIARGVVHLHGGSVQARAAGGGRGTTVTVSLPVAA